MTNLTAECTTDGCQNRIDLVESSPEALTPGPYCIAHRPTPHTFEERLRILTDSRERATAYELMALALSARCNDLNDLMVQLESLDGIEDPLIRALGSVRDVLMSAIGTGGRPTLLPEGAVPLLQRRGHCERLIEEQLRALRNRDWLPDGA